MSWSPHLVSIRDEEVEVKDRFKVLEEYAYGASSASHALCHVSEAALHLFQRAGMPIKRPSQGNSQRRGRL